MSATSAASTPSGPPRSPDTGGAAARRKPSTSGSANSPKRRPAPEARQVLRSEPACLRVHGGAIEAGQQIELRPDLRQLVGVEVLCRSAFTVVEVAMVVAGDDHLLEPHP